MAYEIGETLLTYSQAGYKISVVEFANGEPTSASNSTTGAIDIVSNSDNSQCPGSCFRPVGLAWDSQGRLFFSSDATGEIYMLFREDGNATSSAGSNATGTVPSARSSTGTSSATGSVSPTASSMASVHTFGILAVITGVLAFLI